MGESNSSDAALNAASLTPDVADMGMPLLEHAMEGSEYAESLGGLGMITGPLGIAAGYHEISEGLETGDDGKVVQGGFGGAAGIASTVEGVSSIASYGLGEMGMAGAAETAGLIGEAGAAAAPVLAAGAVGAAIGDGMAHMADSEQTKDGTWGQDDSGQNRSAMDWGASWGTDVDNWLGTKPGDASVLGGIASAAGGIVGGVAGTAQVIGQDISSGVSSLLSW